MEGGARANGPAVIAARLVFLPSTSGTRRLELVVCPLGLRHGKHVDSDRLYPT